MQTRTYFASSVPAALDVARRELGEDAMLVTSKPASAEARPFGRLEVTFAYEAKATMPAKVMPAAPMRAETRLAGPSAPARNMVFPGASSGAPEMDEIRRQIAALKQAVEKQTVGRPDASRSEGTRSAARIPECRPAIAEHLIDNGLSPEVAGEIAATLKTNETSEALAAELTRRLAVAPFAELKSGESRTVALVGPPGRGKTTTLVKIAVRYGLANRVPVKIYLAGSHGVGAEEQMARYASILGVPWQACESLENLSLALNGDQWRGLALIDTPGISPSDAGEIGDFSRFFKRRPEIEKHMVLRADARSADLSFMITRFGAMEMSRLLFTGLDEVVSPGALSDAIMRTGIPAALAGTGQRIPEDLETVSAARLVRSLAGVAVREGTARAPYGEDASAAIAA